MASHRASSTIGLIPVGSACSAATATASSPTTIAGMGRAPDPTEPQAYPPPAMREDARRLLDHLAIPRADVMGYSMGARITAFLALAHPHRLRSAIFGGLGGNMIRPMAGTGPIAH